MSYTDALQQFESAHGNNDQAGMILALREVSKFVLEPTVSPPIQLIRLGTYDNMREVAGEMVKIHTPDWRSVHSSQQALRILDKNISDGFKIRPLLGEANNYWYKDGKASRLDLLVTPSDVDDSPHGRMKSWLRVVTSVDPDYVPGVTRGLLVTDRDLTGNSLFDCSFDGDNIFSPAARSWLPFRVIHREQDSEFFSLGDLQSFVSLCNQINQLVKSESLSFISLLVGHRDIATSLDLGFSFSDTAKFIEGRLSLLAAMTQVPVVCGGFLTKGSYQVQIRARAVSVMLFQKGIDLKQVGVTFLDCGTPSASAPPRSVYRFDGELKCQFRAACLYALSRLTALTLSNLVFPSHLFLARSQERDFVRFCSRRRAKLE